MKTDLFQSCGHCWIFQIGWHIECSNFTASSFRIWKSSTGIPSPPLALLIVMISKARLTSHSRMSGSVRPHRGQPARLPRPWDSPGKNTGVGCHFLLQCMKVKSESEVTQLCPTLYDPMDCSPAGCSIHRIFQARVLEWGAIAFSISSLWALKFHVTSNTRACWVGLVP